MQTTQVNLQLLKFFSSKLESYKRLADENFKNGSHWKYYEGSENIWVHNSDDEPIDKAIACHVDKDIGTYIEYMYLMMPHYISYFNGIMSVLNKIDRDKLVDMTEALSEEDELMLQELFSAVYFDKYPSS